MENQRNQSLRDAAALLRASRTGTLSVIDPDNSGPFGALVNVAVDEALSPLILISKLSRHTQALEKDQRASVMVHAPLPQDADPLTEMRVTMTGPFHRSDDPAVRATYLARHPYAELYASFGDFGFWRMQPAKLYVVAGFGRVYAYDFEELAKAA